MLISDAANLTNEVATEHVAVDVKTEARRLIGEGRSVVPIPKGEKGPQRLKWQDLRLKADEVDAYFRGNNRNIGVILGKPSGGLADVDLDCDEAVRLAPKYLPPTGCITGRTGQPGRHWWYISKDCETARHRDKLCKGEGATVVELRSTGHQTVVGPSIHPDGSQYDNLEGGPTVVDAEVLTAAVEALYQAVLKERGHEGQGETTAANPKPVSVPSSVVADGSTQRPGDDYNQRATQSSMVSYLQSQGFTQDGTSEHGIRLRRPGKDDGCSLAVCLNGAVVNWSTSLPLDVSEPDAPKPMAPFNVYTRLEHNGDHSAAARALRSQGYGSDDSRGVDLSGFQSCQNTSVTSMGGDPDSDEIPEAKIPVNQEFPPHLLKVPGFVGQVTQYMLSTAKRPQPALSLWAALCLQAVLCGRKIRDPFGGRTNLYVMALASSGLGKDHPRQMNQKILIGAGLLEHEGPEDIASDSGLLSAVAHEPALLMQLDEVGRLLKSCAAAGSHSSHLYNIKTLLLRLYTSAGGMYKGKAYGDRAKNIEIDQPCLSIYGSTVAASFWGSMSSESIADGFLARMIPVIGDEEPPSYLPHQLPVPESILMHAQSWGGYRPNGLLGTVHPGPTVVEYTIEAEEILTGWRDQWEKTAKAANEWRPVWVRAAEKACRLALVYVASKGTKALRVDADAITWACEVSDYTTSLFQSVGDQHIADSEFERRCQRVYQAILNRGKEGMTPDRLSKQRCWRSLLPRERQEVMSALLEDRRIIQDTTPGGRGTLYFAAQYAPPKRRGVAG